MRRIWFLDGVAAGAVVASLLGWTAGTAARAASAAPVVIETLHPADFNIEADALGHVAPLNSVRIRPQVGGQLMSVTMREGASVTAGEVVARIDPRVLQATVDQDRAVTAQDRAAQRNAEAILARSQPLLAKGLVSAQDIQTQKAQIMGLRAKVMADEAVEERDRVSLGFTDIVSPIAGVAGILNVTVGNVVTPQDPAGLIVVTQMQPIGVLFPIRGTLLPELQKAMRSAGPSGVPVEAWSQSGQEKLATGALSAIDNQVDATTGTVTLKALFPNQDRSLWPGDFVNVRLILSTRHDALSVPIDALENGADGASVWTVAPDGKARTVPVRVVQSVNGRALVEGGLKSGDRVVVNGQYGLTNDKPTDIVSASQSAQNGKPLQNSNTDQLGISP